ncbi:hypothetical protein LXL04_003197 [Taraxacum kok-saghyz]
MNNPLTIEADDDFVNDEIELKEGNVAIEMQEVKRETMLLKISYRINQMKMDNKNSLNSNQIMTMPLDYD